jgi:hypothetical protein
MKMKYEADTSIVNTHTIESSNTLCCAETGRVVAVFYNDYDLNSVIELSKEIEELKKEVEVENKIVIHWKELFYDADERAQDGFYNCRDKRIEIEELKKTLVLRNQTIDGFLSLS